MAEGSGEDKYKFEISSYLLSWHFYPVLSEVAEGSDKDKLQLFVTFPLGSGSTRAPQVESVKRPPFTSTGHFECFQKSLESACLKDSIFEEIRNVYRMFRY